MDVLKHLNLFLLILCCAFTISEFTNVNRLLRRKKRYLVFNEGSNFECQVTLAKPFLGIHFPSNWNTVLETEITYKLPNTTLRFHKHKKRPYIYHRRDRRDLYTQLESIFNNQGVDGRACVLRTICEAQTYLKPGNSFLQDLIHVLFRLPQVEYEVDDYDIAATQESCDTWTSLCPVSVISLFLTSS